MPHFLVCSLKYKEHSNRIQLPVQPLQIKQAFFPFNAERKLAGFQSSVVDTSTSMAVKTVNITIKDKTIVNMFIISYQVLSPSEPGGACWIMLLSGIA